MKTERTGKNSQEGRMDGRNRTALVKFVLTFLPVRPCRRRLTGVSSNPFPISKVVLSFHILLRQSTPLLSRPAQSGIACFSSLSVCCLPTAVVPSFYELILFEFNASTHALSGAIKP